MALPPHVAASLRRQRAGAAQKNESASSPSISGRDEVTVTPIMISEAGSVVLNRHRSIFCTKEEPSQRTRAIDTIVALVVLFHSVFSRSGPRNREEERAQGKGHKRREGAGLRGISSAVAAAAAAATLQDGAHHEHVV